MQRPLPLPEAAARNDADARGVEEAEAVELVRGAVFLGGLFDGAGREGDGGVEVHGALEGKEGVLSAREGLFSRAEREGNGWTNKQRNRQTRGKNGGGWEGR